MYAAKNKEKEESMLELLLEKMREKINAEIKEEKLIGNWGGEFEVEIVDSLPSGSFLSLYRIPQMQLHEIALPVKKVVQFLNENGHWDLEKVVQTRVNEVFSKLKFSSLVFILRICSEDGFLPCSEGQLAENSINSVESKEIF